MRVKTKKTEDEIKRTFFGPVQKAAQTVRPWTEVEPTWCELSETRLFCKIVEYKPAGVNRNFNLAIIADHMWNIYENEMDCEEYLSPEDLITVRERRESAQPVNKLLHFIPKYKIRPTIEQIEKKLEELYYLPQIEENEGFPEEFEKEQDFFLPDGEYSEMIQNLEKPDSDKSSDTMLPPPGPPRKKRRRGGSTDSGSRGSTPQFPRGRIDREHDF